MERDDLIVDVEAHVDETGGEHMFPRFVVLQVKVALVRRLQRHCNDRASRTLNSHDRHGV